MERGSQTRDVYAPQHTSRMRTAKVKEEEEEDTRMVVRE